MDLLDRHTQQLQVREKELGKLDEKAEEFEKQTGAMEETLAPLQAAAEAGDLVDQQGREQVVHSSQVRMRWPC